MSLKITAKKYLAVKKAEIDLSGITVISGINGSGKSTLAHSTYKLLDKALNYSRIVDDEMSEKLSAFSQTLFSSGNNLSGIIPRNDAQKLNESLFFSMVNRHKNLEDRKTTILQTMETMSQCVKEIKTFKTEKQANQYKAFVTLLSNLVGNKTTEGVDIGAIFSALREKIEGLFSSSELTKSNRGINVFQNSWKRDFRKALNPMEFNVEENNVPIIDAERNIVSLPDSVKNVVYIDSPMAFGEENSRRDHWNELNAFIKNDKTFGPKFDYSTKEPLGILKGDFEWDKQKTSVTYKLPNGVSFDLFNNGATGLKSFTILQLLFREGFIGDKTLLIIDEPEAHLHPQWIVHFARFIVLLRKATGCSFLISSHSTDMVSSLKYISEKELGHSADFYMAEQSKDDEFEFEYRHLGDDIEPIFETFNKSFKVMDSYSGDPFNSSNCEENKQNQV